MGFWRRLFGKQESELAVKRPATEHSTEEGRKLRPRSEASSSLTEKDNRGTRQDTFSQANAYWKARMFSSKKDPFVLYKFRTENDAREALLELPCMRIAEDSRKLICTEPLIFGCYQDDRGKYAAIVCGAALTHEMWELAKQSFAKHGGTLDNDREPEKKASAIPATGTPSASNVVFVREYDKQSTSGLTYTYRLYKTGDAASAKMFLEQNPVTQKYLYLVVETPEGNFGRDIGGTYEE